MNNQSWEEEFDREFTFDEDFIAANGETVKTVAAAKLIGLIKPFIHTVEQNALQKGREEVILGALNSNNPLEWLKNYALYHSISLTPEEPNK